MRESPISSTPAEPGTKVLGLLINVVYASSVITNVLNTCKSIFKVTIKQQAVAPRRPVPDASLPLFDDDDDDQDFGAPDINIDSLLSQSDGTANSHVCYT